MEAHGAEREHFVWGLRPMFGYETRTLFASGGRFQQRLWFGADHSPRRHVLALSGAALCASVAAPTSPADATTGALVDADRAEFHSNSSRDQGPSGDEHDRTGVLQSERAAIGGNVSVSDPQRGAPGQIQNGNRWQGCGSGVNERGK